MDDDEDWSVWWCYSCQATVPVAPGADGTMICRLCGGNQVREFGANDPLPTAGVSDDTSAADIEKELGRIGKLNIGEIPG